MIEKDVQNFIFAIKFSSIFLLHGKHSFGKVINKVWYQARDLMRFIQQTHIYILHQTYEYHLSYANGTRKTKRFSFCKINATKFGTKYEIAHKIIYHYWASYGYIIMIIVDSCIIWFHLDCIMHLKKSHYIATNVSRKSATTFGDLPDWL